MYSVQYIYIYIYIYFFSKFSAQHSHVGYFQGSVMDITFVVKSRGKQRCMTAESPLWHSVLLMVCWTDPCCDWLDKTRCEDRHQAEWNNYVKWYTEHSSFSSVAVHDELKMTCTVTVCWWDWSVVWNERSNAWLLAFIDYSCSELHAWTTPFVLQSICYVFVPDISGQGY